MDESVRGLSAEAVYARDQNQQQLDQEDPDDQQQGSDQTIPQNAPDSPQSNEQSPEGSSSPQEPAAPSGAPRSQQTVSEGLPNNTDSGPCPTGEVIDAPADTREETMDEGQWQIASEQAMRVAAKAGKLPAGIAETMETQIRGTATDWRGELRDFFEQIDPVDFSWLRPDRRIEGVLLPGVDREELGTVIWVADTSTSIGKHVYRAFADNLGALLRDLRPKQVLFVQCDAAIQSVEEFEPGEEPAIRRRGFGGTRFRPVFDWVEREGHQPAALIYLTDLECYDQPEEPDYPVLWVTPEWISKVGPFGRTLRIQT
jgi:hypothetical protein